MLTWSTMVHRHNKPRQSRGVFHVGETKARWRGCQDLPLSFKDISAKRCERPHSVSVSSRGIQGLYSDDTERALKGVCSHVYIKNGKVSQIVVPKSVLDRPRRCAIFNSASLFVFFPSAGLPECEALHFLSTNSIHPSTII